MYIKMTRLARAGNIGSLAAMGVVVAACARLRSASKPNPQERDCNISRRFMGVILDSEIRRWRRAPGTGAPTRKLQESLAAEGAVPRAHDAPADVDGLLDRAPPPDPQP